MSMGEQDEVYWSNDGVAPHEILAAEYMQAIELGRVRSGRRRRRARARMYGEMTRQAYTGWKTHQNGMSPADDSWYSPADAKQYLAGWLARQIYVHGMGDDSAHVERGVP